MSRSRTATPVLLGRPATWLDLENVPEDQFAEIVDGELRVARRPAMPHGRAATDLGGLLTGPFRFGVGGPGGWVFIAEPYIRFGAEIRAPDLAGWRRERWVGQPRRGPLGLIPDWICEVLSESTAREDRTVKRDLYARHGVKHLSLIDPDSFTLEVYRREEIGWYLVSSHGGDEKVRAEPFEAVAIDLSFLWEPTEPGGEGTEG